MKIYLAARYSRREELLAYKADLERLGHKVTSRWLSGDHQWSGVENATAAAGDDAGEIPLVEAQRFAREDLEDLGAARLVICFTEEPRSGASRGGRHVEYGVALEAGKMIAVVGPRENVFYTLDSVFYHRTWPQCLQWLRNARKKRG